MQVLRKGDTVVYWRPFENVIAIQVFYPVRGQEQFDHAFAHIQNDSICSLHSSTMFWQPHLMIAGYITNDYPSLSVGLAPRVVQYARVQEVQIRDLQRTQR